MAVIRLDSVLFLCIMGQLIRLLEFFRLRSRSPKAVRIKTFIFCIKINKNSSLFLRNLSFIHVDDKL